MSAVITERLADRDMPADHDWLVIERNGSVYVLVKASASDKALREAQGVARRVIRRLQTVTSDAATT